MASKSLPKIYADYPRILLMEANGDCPTVEVPGLVDLLNACIEGDEVKLRTYALLDPRQRVRSAAAFILRKHEFEVARSESVASMSRQLDAESLQWTPVKDVGIKTGSS